MGYESYVSGSIKIVPALSANGLDNRRANLRAATRSQQGANRRDRRGASRFKGVSWSEERGRWQAHIRVNGKSIGLGRFDEEIEAARAYDKAALSAWGEYASLNLPEEGQ